MNRSTGAVSAGDRAGHAVARNVGGAEWVGVVLLTLSGLLSGVLESLLVPIYAGTAVVPLAVLLAVVSNVALPRMARALIPSGPAVLLPFLGWLVVVIGFAAVARPEGDVILPGAPGAVEYVVYGMLLGGAIAGTVTLVMSAPPPSRRLPADPRGATAPPRASDSRHRHR